MKKTDFYPLENILLALLGGLLLATTYFAANNAFSTYMEGEKNRQASAWSVLQLYKEIQNMSFQSGLYASDLAPAESLQIAYEILWSRISVTKTNLLHDSIFIASNKGELDNLLDTTYDHIKAIEPIIFDEAALDKQALNEWTIIMKHYGNSISMSLLHDLISTNSEYSKALRNSVIKAAGLLLLATLAVILYLIYLLSALWRQRNRHQYLLDHDSLTGLYSRDYTMSLLQTFCDKKIPFTLLSFDINKFKSINDNLGHLAGDDLLKYFATISGKSLGQHGFVGRIGGDEFLYIIQSEEIQEVNKHYSKFLALLEKPYSIQGYPVYLHVSTGACLAVDCEFNSNLLLERVDEAMYRAKKISQRVIFWYGTPIKRKAAIKAAELEES